MYVFNIEKWNAIVYTKKLFPIAKLQVLGLGNNFSMYIVSFHYFVLKAFYPTNIKIATL